MKNDFALLPKRITFKIPTVGEFANDGWAGFAAMLVALPSSIAYGVAIYDGLGPQYLAEGALAGIIGAFALGLIAPLFGGAPRLVSAPSAPAAAVMTSLATTLLAGNGRIPPLPADHVLLLLMIATLLAGALQLAYGMVGGGQIIKYIPYPVISGYISAVGILILLDQIGPFFGFPRDVDVAAGLMNPSVWQWSSLTIGTLTIVGVIVAPRIMSSVPPIIIGLLTGMVAYIGLSHFGSIYFPFDRSRLVIGPIGSGAFSISALVTERWTALGELKLGEIAAVFAPALTLSIILSIDTLKTCVIVDTLTRSRHNSDHELFGQGFANVVSALAGGLPGSGTMGATLVNLHSGARTKLSGLLEGLFALLTFLLLGRLISGIPSLPSPEFSPSSRSG